MTTQNIINIREKLLSAARENVKSMISKDPILAELTQGDRLPTAAAYKARHPVSQHWHKDPEIVPLAYTVLSSMELHVAALKKLRGEN